jgi:MFS family permease
VRLVVAARAVNRLGAFSLSFLTVLVTADFAASAATAGFVSAAFGVATIPSRLAGGRLADRLGRRRTVVLGLTGCAAAQCGIAAAPSLTAVAACAVLLGLFFEVYEPPSQAVIADAVGPADRTRAYGLLNAALAAAGVGAGLIAAGVGRWDLRWLFVVDAATCLACAVVVRLVLPPDAPVATAAAAGPGPSPWRDRALLAMLACGTLFALIYLQLVIALPLGPARVGRPAADAGLLFTTAAVTIVAGQPLLRLRHLDALRAPAALASGYALLAAGLAGYAWADSLPAFTAWTVCWSLGDLLLMGRMYAAVADLAPPGATGRYLAAFGTSWGVATVTAPVAATQLLDRAGPTALWLTLSALTLLLAVVHPWVLRTAWRAPGPVATATGPKTSV